MRAIRNRRWVVSVMMLLAALALATPTNAQQFTGRIDVTVADSSGALLPGVNVEITGPLNISRATGPDGMAHFLNLVVGTYQVKATLQGFTDYVNTNVPVVAGGAVPLKVVLGVRSVQETVTVTSQSPVIDIKKTGTATNVTLDELQNIPSGRDPWVVLQTVPGIIVDRVNVGGSESGQQSGYQAKGANSTDATWNMDGVPITDMAATGASPTYYDFDMFQEMGVTTGGAAMTSPTGGVQLSFILRSGQNTPHGSSRLFFENENMQSNNMSPALATSIGSPNGKGNRTNQYADYGFELGGPIVRDRLWAWGSLGKTDVRLLTIKQTPDRTILKNRSFKTQAQMTRNLRGSFTYFFGGKTKYGRNAGPTRPPETAWNQGSLRRGLFKGEGNIVAGDNLFLTGRYAHYGQGFFLTPVGGLDKQIYQDDAGAWHGSFYDYRTDRPQDFVSADGSYFKGKHELKFGFSFRKVKVNSNTVWPGNKIVTYFNSYPNLIAEAQANYSVGAEAKYIAGWVGDTITADRWTLQAGVRFDRQGDSILPTTAAGVPIAGFAKYLPDLQSTALKNAILWNSVTPRVSISYALDQNRKTLLRGSYALFASQLGNGASGFVSTIQYRYIAFDAVDLNGNNLADPNEIDFSSREWWSGFDINNPGSQTSVNKIGGYSVPKTHEVIVGLDHELMPNFGVSTAFTYRKYVDFNWQPRIGVRASDYVQAGTLSGTGLPNGSSYAVPYYFVPEANASAEALGGGREYVTRDGYSQRFLGVEVTATKRLADRWMARVAFSSNKHQQFYANQDALGAFGSSGNAGGDPTSTPTAPNLDGGLVVTQSGGSGKSGIYQLLPLYQFIATGLYQAPGGVDFGMNLNMRQGFGQPWFRTRVSTPNDAFSGLKTVLVNTDVGKNRLPTVTTLDLRVGKTFRINRTNFIVDFDVFNVLNTGTVLGRTYDLRLTGATGFNQTLEIINPRIARIGLRFNF